MSSKIRYQSIGKTTDGTNFCSAVDALAEHILEDNEKDSVIVFPSATSWASMRSSSYWITADNTEMVLPFPIYRIKKILLKPTIETLELEVYEKPGDALPTPRTVNISEFKDDQGNPFELDITDMVLTRKEWDVLPLSKDLSDYENNIRKDNTFYFEEGGNIIRINVNFPIFWMA